MTGGRIGRIKKYVGDNEFMITYGDGLIDVNINKLLKFHKSHNKILTVTGVRPPGRFGEMVSETVDTQRYECSSLETQARFCRSILWEVGSVQ